MVRANRSAKIAAACVFVGLAAAALAVWLLARPTPGHKTSPSDPFLRPATRADRLPGWVALTSERIVASRRVAIYRRDGRSADLYVARTASRGLCTILVAERAAAGGCNENGSWGTSVAFGLHYAFGISGARTASIVVTGARGRQHRVRPGEAGAFIVRCRAIAAAQPASARSSRMT
jgi:hypothetical protein